MSQGMCRWGVLGAATIARKNWRAIREAGNSRLAAVASRSPERAAEFVAACQASAPLPEPPAVCNSYEELLARDDVDAVYVPIPTGLRKEWVIRAAEAGKHVLCEKPCAPHADDLRAMLAACEKHHVQFMDGVMFMHSGRLARLRELLDDGRSVGAIRRITSGFSFRGGDEFLAANIRMSSALEPLGCLGDLGWYNLRFTLWANGTALPREVSGRMLAEAGRPDSPSGVPTEFSAELLFDGGLSAGFFCSFLAENQQWAVVSGTKGFVRLDDFVLPFYGSEANLEVVQSKFEQHGCDFNMLAGRRRETVGEYSNGYADSQETRMIRRFAEIALSGALDPTWPEIALRTQLVLDACLASARAGGKPVAVG